MMQHKKLLIRGDTMEQIDDILDNFYYEMYIAEKEMLDEVGSRLEILDNVSLSESAIEVLQEGVKENLMKYIHKIVAGTQNAWNNFKSTIADKGIGKFYNENAEYFKKGFVMKPPAGYSIPNIKEYEKFISNTTIDPYTDALNPYLDNEKNFLSRQLSAYSAELKDKKLREIAEKRLFTIAKGTENIGDNQMNEITRFAVVEYKKVSDKLSTNLKNLNVSTRTMEGLMRSISTAEPAKTESTIENTMEYYFTEEGKETSGNKSSTTDSSEKKGFTSANDDKKEDNKTELDKIAKVYFKASTSVISEQLFMTNKMVVNCFKMMNEFVRLQKKEQPKKEESSNKETPAESNASTQVKID